MTTQADIRQSFELGAASAPLVTVFQNRHIDKVEDNLPAVVIFLESVSVDQDLGRGRHYSANLSVRVMDDRNDNELDLLVNQIIDGITSQMETNHPTSGFDLVEINYVRDFDPGIGAVEMHWEVMYV